jgi:hypothetical protein
MLPVSNDRDRRAVRLARLRSHTALIGLAVAAAIALPAPPASAAGGNDPADLTAAGLRGLTTGSVLASGDSAGTPYDPSVTIMPAGSDLLLRGPQPLDSGEDMAPAAPDTADQADEAEPPLTSVRIPPVSGNVSANDRNDLGRINLRERPIGAAFVTRPAAPLDQAPGIRVGTFILRPELTQSIGHESQKTGSFREDRTYSQTTLRGSLTSDWSRHKLTVTGSGTFQKNISGSGETEPYADVSADLRLDLAPETTADLTAGYNFYRESSSDPNAVIGAASQGTVNNFTGGVALSRQLGLLRGSLSAKAIRTTYGDVRLLDGSTLSQADRNTLAGEFGARLGYQLSPAIMPFVEAKYRRTDYDNTFDSFGFRRSSDTYTAEAGVAADFGEKVSGEFAAGYVLRRFEDSRLADLDGLAVDATGHWSPHRGTDISVGLATALEESTTPGDSGPITYVLDTALTQQVRNDVVARLGARYLYRDYRHGSVLPDQEVYTATAGLSWFLSPYLSLDGNLGFERTTQKGADDQDTATVDMGLTVRR